MFPRKGHPNPRGLPSKKGEGILYLVDEDFTKRSSLLRGDRILPTQSAEDGSQDGGQANLNREIFLVNLFPDLLFKEPLPQRTNPDVVLIPGVGSQVDELQQGQVFPTQGAGHVLQEDFGFRLFGT